MTEKDFLDDAYSEEDVAAEIAAEIAGDMVGFDMDPQNAYDQEPYPEEVYGEEETDPEDEGYPEDDFYPEDEPDAEEAQDADDGIYGEETIWPGAAAAEEPAGDAEEELPALREAAPEMEVIPAEPKEKLPRKRERKKETEGTSQERPAYKGRPKPKKGAGLWGIPHLIATLIWLLVIVAIGVSMGRILWVCAADVLAFGRESKEVTVTITAEDSLEDVAAKLEEEGLIRYPDLFLMYADLAKVEEKGKISTGTFTLNTVYDYMALVNAMSPSSGSRKVVEDVLIPEGYSCRQIFERLEEKGVCTVEELEAYAASGELKDYWFLEGVERGDKYCLEGFLFPATYDFYENSSPRQALEKMLNAFEMYFTEEMRAQVDTLNDQLAEMMRGNGYGADFIAEHQMSVRDVITVASMVEEETSSITEGYRIASVIYNRLTNQKEYPYLNIDATIIYALGGDTELTAEKMQVDSPYNSYTNKGLIPGPISNPGLASIEAALEPESTGYHYYVYDESAGEHIFAATYEEHSKNVAKVNGG